MSYIKRTGKQKKTKQNICYDVLEFLKEGIGLLVSIYMLLLVIGLPLYFTDGYARIGTNKYEFFHKTGVGAAIILLPLIVVHVGVWCYKTYKVEESEVSPFATFSLTDKFVAGYGAAVLLSYFFSAYRETGAYGDVWKGTTGWFMGACSQLMFVGIYFVVSRFWKVRKWLPAMWLPVTLVVFVLGLLNRFEIRPIEMENASREFISTIGNINWYCGYLVILLFGGLYYFWFGQEKALWVRILLGLWLVVGFGALITQGSRSGILALLAGFVGLYLLSMKDGEKLERFFLCTNCLGVACTGVYILRKYYGEQYNYNDGLWNYFTNHKLAVVILIVSLVAWMLVKILNRKGKLPMKIFTGIGYAGCATLLLGAIGGIVLIIMNTKNPGSIGTLAENSLFTFNYTWGSNRGATWMAAWKCFADQDLWSKLVGIGPDGMVMYINSGKNEELLQMVREVFGQLNLTNAHNEWFTILVNEGLLGMITYAGIMISAMVRFFKGGKVSTLAGACGMAALAYTANNMFSFQQALATSTMFLVLGMGEAYMRKYSKDL